MNFDLENYFGKKIVGIDEVGRGPLAGPVVAAAVYIDSSLWKRYLKKYPTISKINDSKKISKKNREKIYDILTKIISYGIGASSVKEIEEKNILEASLIAMERAYKSLNINAEMVIVDGINIPKINTNVKAIKNGDNKSISIASASIIAKVLRDNEMMILDSILKVYGFANHKGYGTKEHMMAIDIFGPSIYHRLSFSPLNDRKF